MESTIKNCDVVTQKKLDSFCYKKENFKAAGEIMIVITLDEYRELVGENATAKIRIEKAKHECYEMMQKIKKLENTIEMLSEERGQNAEVAFCSVERDE